MGYYGFIRDSSLPASETHLTLVRRPNGSSLLRFALPMAAGALLALSACRSSIEKADAYEAQYDRRMSVQAYPVALTSIRRAIAEDDTTARRYIKLAEVQMALGRPAAAAGAFQAALDLQPDNIEALENLSILMVRSGQFDGAKRYIEPLLSLSANDPAGLLASGAIAIAERRFADAAKLSDGIIAALPDRADGYVLKARALDALGRSHEATAMLERRALAADDPKDILIQLMQLYRKRGDIQGIRLTAIRLMPLFPEDPRYAIESARAYDALGKDDQVHRIIDDLLQRFAAYPDVLLAIGSFWRDTQPLSVARTEITKVAAGSPPRVRTALADQLIDLGAAQEALSLLASLAPAKITPNNIDSQTHFARALLVTGQIAKAQAKTNAVLAYDAGNPEALLIRARLKLLARDYRGAFTDAQLVTYDDSRNEEAALLVAEIYTRQGNQVLAAGAFGNARQKFPDSVNVLRAEVNWLLGQKRTNEAAQRAVAFHNAHPKSGEATKFYVEICRKTRAPACGFGPPSVVGMLS